MNAVRNGGESLDRLAGAPALHLVARLGFMAKVILYGVIAAFALRAALGRGGATLDVKGALELLADHRTGMAALVLTAAAIAGLGVWFVVEALANPRRQRTLFSRVARLGQAVGGVGYVALAAAGLRVALGEPAGPSGDELARDGVALAFRLPGGPVVAVALGLVAIGVGLRQAHMGLTRGFLENVELGPTSRVFRRVAALAGAVGFATQGAVFASVGVFLIEAVVTRAPREAAGTGGVLEELASRPHGAVLLGCAALGLLAYALYAGIEGACRRFPRAPGVAAAPRRRAGARAATDGGR